MFCLMLIAMNNMAPLWGANILMITSAINISLLTERKNLNKDRCALEQARASRIDCPRPRIEFADNLIYQETRL